MIDLMILITLHCTSPAWDAKECKARLWKCSQAQVTAKKPDFDKAAVDCVGREFEEKK